MFFYGIHFLVVMSWAIFLLEFIKTLQNNLKDKYLFGILSIIFMFIVLFVGTKLILLNPSVSKSGIWLHLKLSIDILLMIENVFLLIVLFKKKTFSAKFYIIMYWFSYLAFISMAGLSMFRPF